MRLDHAWIAAHIPHQGSMCLLDAVTEWSKVHIRCSATSHRDPANPMRARNQLGIACGIEYAAQSMAIHGALLASAQGAGASKPSAGFLAGLRNVKFLAPRLDDLPGEILCQASRVAGDGDSALYEFEVRSATSVLLTGRATVVLDVHNRMTL